MQVLSVEYQGNILPVIELDDRKDRYGKTQIVIRFIHQGGARWTLHEQDQGILLTISHPDFSSTWSEHRVQNARVLGYSNPEKHGKYLNHALLHKIDNVHGYELGSHRLKLEVNGKDLKYLRNAISIGSSVTISPMVKMVLSTPDNLYNSSYFKLPTSLGDLFFELEE